MQIPVWLMFAILGGLCFIAIDHIRLQINNFRLHQFSISNAPIRAIMVSMQESAYMRDKVHLFINVRKRHHIFIKSYQNEEEAGYHKIVFDNDDELLLYDYEKAKIIALTEYEKQRYEQNLFLDYKLPPGAQRAIVEKLGLLDYMIKVGICTENNGGK